jgi:hypothetical protein
MGITEISVGTRIRRKLSRKQKNRPNNHPIYTLVEFYKASSLDMVALRAANGEMSYMLKEGLEGHEVVK